MTQVQKADALALADALWNGGHTTENIVSAVELLRDQHSFIEVQEAAHLSKLTAYRTTVQNLEAELAALKAAPAAVAVPAVMTHAEAAAALCINSALHRIREGNPAGAIEPLEQARAALAATPAAGAPVVMPEPDGHIMDSLPDGRLEYRRGKLNDADALICSTRPVFEWGTVHGVLAGVSAQADAFKRDVYAALGIGSACDKGTVFVNIDNLRRRADCLAAVELEFFMVAIPPDEEEGDTEPGEECLLNWGHTPEQYVKQFAEALATMQAAGAAQAVEPGAVDLLPPMGIRNDRDMLNYLMNAFASEIHYCERCGHGEDTKDMDSASFLRDYLAAAPQAAATQAADTTLPQYVPHLYTWTRADALDAARYRYLRDVPMCDWPDGLALAIQCQQNAKWDAAIDAAIAAQAAQKGGE